MKKFTLVLLSLVVCFLVVGTALAATKIEQISDIGNFNDYVVGPGKQYLFLDPGQSVTREIDITNRFQKTKKFKLELEDFKGQDGVSPIEFMGLLAGPYSLKDYIKPEVMEFSLKPGDRITVPVKISIPKDAVPGGLYGTVIVTTQDEQQPGEVPPNEVKGALPVKSRLAVLYFVRVNGPVKEEGSLKDFSVGKKIFWNTDKAIEFSYSFANTGNVYLNPYGRLEVTNFFGAVVDSLEVNASYVLPSSTRINTIKWDKGFSMGRYKAKLTLNKGFLGKTDEQEAKTLTFWVIPWKLIVILLVVLFIIIAIIRGLKSWFKNNFERKRKL